MPSALQTMSYMNPHHGYGVGHMLLGTADGAVASAALGTLYGKFYGKPIANWLPAIFALAGKAGAIALFLATGGRTRLPVVMLNDWGQAGVNALGLNLGVKLGLKWAGKQLAVMDDKAMLPAGAVRVAGELPPADPGRSLENITVEDLANLS